MKLANPFPDSVRLLWLGWWECMNCGSNGNERGGLELHHITGRDSNSALNGAVVCKYCHDHMVHTQEEERGLFTKVLIFLKGKRYQLTANDMLFMEKHPYLLVNNEALQEWLA